MTQRRSKIGMTVGKLIKELKKYPETSSVVMASDKRLDTLKACCKVALMRVMGTNDVEVDRIVVLKPRK